MSPDLDALLDWYAGLTPAGLDRIAQFYAADAYFKDPFNELQGHHDITRLYAHMFATLEQPHFRIVTRLQQGTQAFVTWDFDFGFRGRPYRVHGGTHFRFDDRGRITVHRDYWDAAEELLQKLPVVGAPLRWLRRRLALPAAAAG
ncbi:nuclear transport factor 2 family protein [Jeongeupia naejangsanensis]|uniref:Nuclear transport factor 2 family protein n=1 Tax=Jeongeupia naejangsanensis TaxID=613195 RepID=A0ABS2BNQ5_9NEIS|nr:nuclear transport factor 2 family protein [Jeongeupia naejangsanensis]MBM3117257.1 nuclear transport factor 2 family protein [Jeongeupia naejangsanensis]